MKDSIPTDFVSLSREEFGRQFPDEWACLNYLMGYHYSFFEAYFEGICESCREYATFYPVRGYYRYVCGRCKKIYSPTYGTILHKVRHRKKWFYAIWLLHHYPNMTIQELADETQVTFKTAWNMQEAIRNDIDKNYRTKRRERVNIRRTPNGRWRVRMKKDNKLTDIGSFRTRDEAVFARNVARKAQGKTVWR